MSEETSLFTNQTGKAVGAALPPNLQTGFQASLHADLQANPHSDSPPGEAMIALGAAGQGQVETVAIVGLGYVGLPLALAFGCRLSTIGFDVSEEKVGLYRSGLDPSGEVEARQFEAAKRLHVTADASALAAAEVIIVAVPTPVDQANIPDLSPLLSACRLVGRYMKPHAIVVFESTVYPGVTEEVCVPVLERESGLRWKKDFHVGYSPERINPGDPQRTLPRILKVVAGDDAATLDTLASLYGSVVEAGIFKASSIKVAEAAKVIENTQRDLNIALMNELAIICDRLGIDTHEVLEAAGTKWNFLRFQPGLVGGHCIGVDPYYLTHKAQALGYHPQVILAGRRINDGMAKFIAEKTIKQMIACGYCIRGSIVNVLGLTFKENCRDLRNSKAAELIAELRSYGVEVHVHDPLACADEARAEYGLELESWEQLPRARAMVVAVAHSEIEARSVWELTEKLEERACFVDVKSRFDVDALKGAGYSTWRL